MLTKADFTSGAYESLIRFRIKKVLMICSNYDAFTMEEDGRIESRIAKEYADLNISDPPSFKWVNSAAKARNVLKEDEGFDMVICMFNESDEDIFPLASEIKAEGINIPFVLLMHYSREIRRRLTEQQSGSGVDFIFSWHGNADLILAIIKLFEDKGNADNDIAGVGVQAILLVEDSIRYYSTYLPEIYKLVLTQSNEFLKETLNEDQRKNRKRSRPKILLATCYDEAVETYEKYKGNFLGVITDVGMVVHRGDPPKLEKLDAGIDLVKHIRAEEPLMPILMQSSQGILEETAAKLGVGFVKKYSRTLFLQLEDYMKQEFGFGDFIFRDSYGGTEYGRASSLTELETILDTIPDKVLVSNTSRNKFSKWCFARGLFSLGSEFRSQHHAIASEARDFLKSEIIAYRKFNSRGIIANFDEETYDRYITFARMGEGSLGGKARGLAFLNRLVYKYGLVDKYEDMEVSIPRTIVISTDFFDEFIESNGLQYVIDSELSDDEILSEFVASRLPERLIPMLRAYVATVGRPLAVRSSSKLEDSDYQPFAGVYSTYMIPVTENKDQMLRMLDKAIKSVYASAFYSGSRTYIHSTGNLQSEEKMSVVIQDICGNAYDGFFFPMISGVARSVNYYPIGNESMEDGIVNVVFGLGKTVVDGGKTLRFNPKYPTKILQLSRPDIAQRSTQDMMYVLDMRPGAFKISRNEGVNFANVPVADAIAHYPYNHLVFSTYDFSSDMIVPGVNARGARLVTYDGILRYGKYPLAQALSDIMAICRKELTGEVEMEFAAEIKESGSLGLKLLQVRPINRLSASSEISMEDYEKSTAHKLLSSDRALGAGLISDMDRIVYVPASKFDNMKTVEIAAELSEINNRCVQRAIIIF